MLCSQKDYPVKPDGGGFCSCFCSGMEVLALDIVFALLHSYLRQTIFYLNLMEKILNKLFEIGTEIEELIPQSENSEVRKDIQNLSDTYWALYNDIKLFSYGQ